MDFFYRQKVIGGHIVDFYCHQAKLVIEVDGGQHYTDAGIQKDSRRDSFLKSLGLHVLRYNDLDVLKNCEGVVMNIMEYLATIKINPPVVPL